MKDKEIIYAISNKLNSKIYFGITSREGEKRLYEHELDLDAGRERNKLLQRDYSKYGESCFNFKVIMKTNEGELCELVLIELFSRIGLAYNKRRGEEIEKYIYGEKNIPDEIYSEIEIYIHQHYKNSAYYQDLLNELQEMRTGGFKCKSLHIYNQEFKEQFLARYAAKTQRVVQILFKHAFKYEKKLNKDLYDFTFEEVEEFLCSLHVKTERSIQNQISKLSKYLEFAIEQGVSMNTENYYKNLGKRENCTKYLLFKVRKKKKDKE